MKRYLLIALLSIAPCLVVGQIPVDSIKAIVKQAVASKRSKSIIVGVVYADGTRQIFSEGKLSDKNPKMPDGNTIYEIGSITKVFTSLLLAEMSLKNQLDLNDPISTFLPKTLKVPVRNQKEISLLSLSTNRSGLPRNASNTDPIDPDNPFAEYTRNDLYEFISHFELGRDVDSKWHYSNIGYTLLGDMLSIVGQKDFKTLVDETICRPLTMHNTFFSLPRDRKLLVAQGHTECGQPTGAWDFPLAGGGGLRSTMNDMLAFAEANLGLTQTNLLPAMELTHISRAKKDGNDTYTTMGWTLSNDSGKYILFKDGGTGGYRSFIGLDKRNNIAVVVLSNSNNAVTDIGWHILDPSHTLEPYNYPWTLLDTLRTSIQKGGVEAAIELYQKLRVSNNSAFVFNEKQLNHLGNELSRKKKIKEAIKIYKLNAKEYPKSTVVYESLAEIYRRNKDLTTAITYFEKARELEPQNSHWTYILKKLKRS